MSTKVKVGDLVRATGGIEGPPDSIGTGVVLRKTIGSHRAVPSRWVVLFEKGGEWMLYEDDLEIVQEVPECLAE